MMTGYQKQVSFHSLEVGANRYQVEKASLHWIDISYIFTRSKNDEWSYFYNFFVNFVCLSVISKRLVYLIIVLIIVKKDI